MGKLSEQIYKIQKSVEIMENNVYTSNSLISLIADDRTKHSTYEVNTLFSIVHPDLKDNLKIQVIEILKESNTLYNNQFQKEYSPLGIANKIQEQWRVK